MLATEAGIGTTYAAVGQAITNRENGVRGEEKKLSRGIAARLSSQHKQK